MSYMNILLALLLTTSPMGPLHMSQDNYRVPVSVTVMGTADTMQIAAALINSLSEEHTNISDDTYAIIRIYVIAAKIEEGVSASVVVTHTGYRDIAMLSLVNALPTEFYETISPIIEQAGDPLVEHWHIIMGEDMIEPYFSEAANRLTLQHIIPYRVVTRSFVEAVKRQNMTQTGM